MHQCVYCKSHSCTLLYPTNDLWAQAYHIAYCHVCKAYFLTPFPTDEMLARAYDESYYGCSEKKFEGPVEKVLDYFRQQRARRISKLIPDNVNVLDIGCGNGQFLISLLKYGNYKLYGSELEGKSAMRAAQFKEINLFTGDLTKDTFGDVKFDAITMFHVFEHLTEPENMLETVKLYLKEGGYFVASFPNIDSWQSRIFKGKWLHLDPPRHLFFFKPKDFIALMKIHGFEYVSSSYLSLEQNPYGFIQSFLNLFLKKRDVLFESLKGNKAYTADYSTFQMLLQKLVFAILFPFAVVGDVCASVFKKGATVEFIFRKK